MDKNFLNTVNRPWDYVNEKLNDDEYFEKLEIDVVFKPTDAKIIVDFLIKKIKNERLPRHRIKVANIYEIDPDKLADDYGKLSTEIWYLFTIRDKKYQNDNINISTVDGYWKVKGDDETVQENGETIGFKKIFQFYEGKIGSSSKTSWFMHEFRVIDPLPQHYNVEGQNKLDNWVLCEIWNKERGWYYENEEVMFKSTRRQTTEREFNLPKRSYNLRKKKLIST